MPEGSIKSEGQIRHKIRQVQFRYLKKAIRTALSCRPENCVNNAVLNTETGPIRFCRLADGSGEFVLCDEVHGGLEKAASCPFFECGNNKEKVRSDFKEFLSTSSIAEIAVKFPDMAALLWVLGDNQVQEPNLSLEEEVEIPAAEVPQLVKPLSFGTFRSIDLGASDFSTALALSYHVSSPYPPPHINVFGPGPFVIKP